jgi:hypothetical protein
MFDMLPVLISLDQMSVKQLQENEPGPHKDKEPGRGDPSVFADEPPICPRP